MSFIILYCTEEIRAKAHRHSPYMRISDMARNRRFVLVAEKGLAREVVVVVRQREDGTKGGRLLAYRAVLGFVQQLSALHVDPFQVAVVLELLATPPSFGGRQLPTLLAWHHCTCTLVYMPC